MIGVLIFIYFELKAARCWGKGNIVSLGPELSGAMERIKKVYEKRESPMTVDDVEKKWTQRVGRVGRMKEQRVRDDRGRSRSVSRTSSNKSKKSYSYSKSSDIYDSTGKLIYSGKCTRVDNPTDRKITGMPDRYDPKDGDELAILDHDKGSITRFGKNEPLGILHRHDFSESQVNEILGLHQPDKDNTTFPPSGSENFEVRSKRLDNDNIMDLKILTTSIRFYERRGLVVPDEWYTWLNQLENKQQLKNK